MGERGYGGVSYTELGSTDRICEIAIIKYQRTTNLGPEDRRTVKMPKCPQGKVAELESLRLSVISAVLGGTARNTESVLI